MQYGRSVRSYQVVHLPPCLFIISGNRFETGRPPLLSFPRAPARTWRAPFPLLLYLHLHRHCFKTERQSCPIRATSVLGASREREGGLEISRDGRQTAVKRGSPATSAAFPCSNLIIEHHVQPATAGDSACARPQGSLRAHRVGWCWHQQQQCCCRHDALRLLDQHQCQQPRFSGSCHGDSGLDGPRNIAAYACAFASAWR